MGGIFYIMGPSGAGKDSILDWVKQHLPENAPVIFAHRYITRPANAGGENHVALSKADFIRRKNHGLFKFHWESHGLMYGLGNELDNWVSQGFSVVMNGSRGYLTTASELEPGLIPLMVTVDPEILRERLQTRGRETPEEIEKRLQRASEFSVDHPSLRVVENNGPLEEAGNVVLSLILEQAALV